MPDSTRCQPGDLATVVRADLSDNLGLTVHVLGEHTPDNDWPWAWNGRIIWQCACPEPMHWRLPDGSIRTARVGPVPDDCLRPIRPRQSHDNSLTQPADLATANDDAVHASVRA
ncbi:MAG: hypothetical protein RL014_607 [Pseudomonadota bacterium]|jgi:hypothetical protein